MTFYVKYDADKKHIPPPSNMENWDWNDPNALDQELQNNSFKHGAISGFKQWDLLQLSKADLFQGAIVSHIFPSEPQKLGLLVSRPVFQQWRPNGNPEWFAPLDGGQPFPTEWAMILRPAVSSENPAEWYIEDGSGRAICFLRRLMRESDCTHCAYGYLGKSPDPKSQFIRSHPELLHSAPA